MMRTTCLFLLASLQLAAATPPACTARQTSSGPRQTAFIELYTSEGCSSCPPADKWLSGLRGAGFGPQQVVALAFHVDYWDYLGWRDRFASAANTARQHRRAEQAGAGFVYTPQVLLNGADWRGPSYLRLRSALGELPSSPARLSLNTQPSAGGITAAVNASYASAQRGDVLYLALYEDGLSSTVEAGENEGATLQHDAVVRRLAGPYPFDQSGHLSQQLQLDYAPGQDARRSGIAAWVETGHGGRVVQALALPCAGGEP